MYAALKPGVDGAQLNAQPLTELTLEELRGFADELRAMWALAKPYIRPRLSTALYLRRSDQSGRMFASCAILR
jgi:hypothetical protein